MKRFFHALLLRFLPFSPKGLVRFLSRIPGARLPATSVLIQQRDAEAASRLQRAKPRKFKWVSGSCSIREHMEIVRSDYASYADRRVAILAHWDPDGVVDPYVLYYLDALKRIGYTTILASSCARLKPSAALAESADAVVLRHCTGYDYASLKGAQECLPGVLDARELLMTNDSVIGPIHPLEPVHGAMDALDCDFWGLLESEDRVPHLQGYHLVFRRTALQHPAFRAFWANVDTNADKEHLIAVYELQLTLFLLHQGLRGATFLSADCLPKTWVPGHNYPYWRQLLRYSGYPFVKRDILAGKYSWLSIRSWERELEQYGYPSRLAAEYFARIHRMDT